jgi:hypothetical protein
MEDNHRVSQFSLDGADNEERGNGGNRSRGGGVMLATTTAETKVARYGAAYSHHGFTF